MLRFPGQYYDQESGLHYNRHRYYDPETAQYLTPDPLGLEGGRRPQAYVENPNTSVDPLGLNGCSTTPTSPRPALSSRAISSKADFNKKYGRKFSNDTEAEAAWRVYQQSNQAKTDLVIGRLQDTAAGAELGMTRLNDPNWTINVNDAWVQGGIDANKPFYLGTNPTISNFRSGNPDYPTTVFFREIKQLRDAGYYRSGDYMVPPGG